MPYAFLKPPSTTLRGAGSDILLLAGATMNDWEVELAVVMGSEARNVSEADALGHVAGYTIMNDVSVRDHVADRPSFLGIDWVLAKAADGYAPMGPWITPARFVADPQTLAMELTVNGTTMQKGSTADMLFGVAATIAHLSRTMTLEVGDIIATGTPEGVGFGRKPPVFLQHGDVVRCTIAGLGTLENRFIRG
jgi:2-keto-4-pentenoate hydratase/2-oxohepta-3-ene-1,7-dioic acid hydratase in catechol pathway